MKGSNFQLVSEILRGRWLIEPQFALEMMPHVAALLKGEAVSFYDTTPEQNTEASAGYFVHMDGAGRLVQMYNPKESELPPGSVAIIQQRGAVMKDDFCGVAGTATMRSSIIEVNHHPNVVAAVFAADSPGGAVNGTFELNQTIYESKKPVVGFADGQAGSAAVLELVGCGEIYASHKATQIGSIGICTTLSDYSEHLEEMGVKRRLIIAESAPEKMKPQLDALNGDDTALQAEMVFVHELFKERVKLTRTNVEESTLKGAMYFAEEAKERDLIDGIMSFEDTVARAAELGELMNKKSTYYV